MRNYCLSNFNVLSAVRTLKGKLVWRERKCRFSETSTEAPIHSVYAAIKASAGLKPMDSYLDPNSKGTQVSSSMVVKDMIVNRNSLKDSWVRLFLTSRMIMRTIRMEREGEEDRIISNNWRQEDFLRIPRAKMYSLESRMSNKFFPPNTFAVFTNFCNYLGFSHFIQRRSAFGNKRAGFLKMFFSFFDINTHN